MAAKSAARDAPDDLFAAIVALSEELKAAQQSGAATGSLIAASVPLFARLRALVRDGSLDSRQRKETALEARKEVDAANLALQNLQYEQAHLEREIRACQSYECVGAVLCVADRPAPSMATYRSSRRRTMSRRSERTTRRRIRTIGCWRG